MSRVVDFLERSTGLPSMIARAVREPVAGGARWSYVFGSALLVLFLVQIVTGCLLAMYFAPGSQEAWGSVHYIQHELAFGWFVRGMHHWSASGVVVLLGVHVGQVILFGANRRPRQITWVVGAGLLAMMLAMSLTGYLLPWDQKGYWASRVVASLVSAVPGIGGWLLRLLQGGNGFGTLTLTRFYGLHALVLPGLLITGILLHVILFRRNGTTPRWDRTEEDVRATTEPFWPRQVAYDLVFGSSLVLLVAGVTIAMHGAPLDAPADPSSSYPARPEWYFLWLFQALKYVPGRFEGLIVTGVMLAAFALLVALPWIDRGKTSRPRDRLHILVPAAAVIGGAFVLTGAAQRADARDPGLAAERSDAALAAQRSFALARRGVPPGGPLELYQNDPRERGERLYEQKCRSCHRLGGRGGDAGPDLTGYLTEPWVSGLVANPRAPQYYGGAGLDGMDGAKLDAKELSLVSAYVLSLGGRVTEPPGGADLFEDSGCAICHARAGEETKRGPTLAGFGSRAWLRGVVLDPNQPKYFGDASKMPAFHGELTNADIDDLLTFLLSPAAAGGASK